MRDRFVSTENVGMDYLG